MSGNVIFTGVKSDQPRPAAPDDGWEWIPVIVYGEWRYLRGMKKRELRA